MIHEFEYFAPTTLEEALTLLSEHKGKCKIIAGGQSLLVLMRLGLIAPGNLIDIKGVTELDYLRVDGTKGLRIGALTTHRRLESSELLGEKLGVIAEMEHGIASVETRNWGTVGGNVAHADPAGDLLPVLIALKATMTAVGPGGERVIDAEAFPTDYLETDLRQDEILKEITVPIPKDGTGAAYEKFKIVEEDYATVSAAVSIRMDKKRDACEDVRIVLGSVGPTALRVPEAEAVVKTGDLSEKAFEEAGEAASKEIDPVEDMHSSAEYKRELVRVFVKRIGMKALERAQNA